MVSFASDNTLALSNRRNASGGQDAAALRASVEQDVRAELKHLRRLRDAGVESWKEVTFSISHECYVLCICLCILPLPISV